MHASFVQCRRLYHIFGRFTRATVPLTRGTGIGTRLSMLHVILDAWYSNLPRTCHLLLFISGALTYRLNI